MSKFFFVQHSHWLRACVFAACLGLLLTMASPVWAVGIADTRDRALLATIERLERPEFYRNCYCSSLALLSLVMMMDNGPVP